MFVCASPFAQALCVGYPILAYLTLPQSVMLHRKLLQWADQLRDGDTDEDSELPITMITELSIWFQYCGVDPAHVTPTLTHDAMEEFADDCGGDVDLNNVLKCVKRLGTWLSTVAGGAPTLTVPASKCLPAVGAAGGSVGLFSLTADPCTVAAVYKLVRHVYQGAAPHWSQVLWCDGSTTESDVTLLWHRCVANPAAVYVLVVQEPLPLPVSECVHAALCKLAAGVGPHKAGPPKLALITPADSPLRRLCVNWVDCRKVAASDAPPVFTPRFAHLSVRRVIGECGSGKSFAIAKALEGAAESGIVRVRVNEAFSVDSVIKRLWSDANAMPAVVTFVFHVSAFANFREFDAFLFRLLVTGTLVGASGEVVCIPAATDVRVYVEVPNPLPVHDPSSDARGERSCACLWLCFWCVIVCVCVTVLRSTVRFRANHRRTVFEEGTVGSGSAAIGVEKGLKPGTCCPCIACVRVATVGLRFDEGPIAHCGHLLPALTCVPTHTVVVAPHAPFERTHSSTLALRMLRAFLLEREGDSCVRAVVATPAGPKFVTSKCGPTCPKRAVIDAVALRGDGRPTIRGVPYQVLDEATGALNYNIPALDTPDVIVRRRSHLVTASPCLCCFYLSCPCYFECRFGVPAFVHYPFVHV